MSQFHQNCDAMKGILNYNHENDIKFYWLSIYENSFHLRFVFSRKTNMNEQTNIQFAWISRFRGDSTSLNWILLWEKCLRIRARIKWWLNRKIIKCLLEFKTEPTTWLKPSVGAIAFYKHFEIVFLRNEKEKYE